MDKIDQQTKQRRVAIWLLVGVFMIVIQIIIGGITRLTGSGLSITEWKPILGAIPPLNEADWQMAFEKYKGIAQYKFLNADFTLSDFKFIYFWEWFHRQWARLLGVVFAIPFIYFLAKKYFSKRMIAPLVILFLLGGLQGAIGWIMVQSGLNDTDVHVSHIRLTIHFIAALVLLVYTFWFALRLLIPPHRMTVAPDLKRLLAFTLVVFTVQLIFGGLMAGLKAANFAPTWPSVNGQAFPPTLGSESWTNHPINVHFVHRGLAYLLFVLVLYSSFRIWKHGKTDSSGYIGASAFWPFILVTIQVVLGIFTVLSSLTIVPGHFGLFESLAAFHQLTAIALLLALSYQFYLVHRGAGST